jgi:hypothetical protein
MWVRAGFTFDGGSVLLTEVEAAMETEMAAW